jgi:hypothetical protein
VACSTGCKSTAKFFVATKFTVLQNTNDTFDMLRDTNGETFDTTMRRNNEYQTSRFLSPSAGLGYQNKNEKRNSLFRLRLLSSARFFCFRTRPLLIMLGLGCRAGQTAHQLSCSPTFGQSTFLDSTFQETSQPFQEEEEQASQSESASRSRTATEKKRTTTPAHQAVQGIRSGQVGLRARRLRALGLVSHVDLIEEGGGGGGGFLDWLLILLLLLLLRYLI